MDFFVLFRGAFKSNFWKKLGFCPNQVEIFDFDQLSLDKVSKRRMSVQSQGMEGSTVEVKRQFLKFFTAAIGGSSDQRCIF